MVKKKDERLLESVKGIQAMLAGMGWRIEITHPKRNLYHIWVRK